MGDGFLLNTSHLMGRQRPKEFKGVWLATTVHIPVVFMLIDPRLSG